MIGGGDSRFAVESAGGTGGSDEFIRYCLQCKFRAGPDDVIEIFYINRSDIALDASKAQPRNAALPVGKVLQGAASGLLSLAAHCRSAGDRSFVTFPSGQRNEWMG